MVFVLTLLLFSIQTLTDVTQRLFLFNPANEAALALPTQGHYTPPKLVRRMSADLSPLFRYLITEGDLVWSPYSSTNQPFILPAHGAAPPMGMATCRTTENPLHLVPWGLAPSCHRHWSQLALIGGLSPIVLPETSIHLSFLSDRSISVEILSQLRGQGFELDTSLIPQWVTTEAQLTDVLQALPAVPIIAKLPHSSSGRGLLYLSVQPNDRELKAIRQALISNGRISIEPRLSKESDWAMEYESDGQGCVRFVGYSHFITTEGGQYLGNVLDSQYNLREDFARRMGGIHRTKQIQRALGAVLADLYGCHYKGPLGVDMLFYQREDEGQGLRLHPCIEVNMRHTMGLLAIQLGDKLLAREAQGFFRIATARSSLELQRMDQELRRVHPLKLTKDKQIVSGYFALNAIEPDTRFLGYIMVRIRNPKLIR